MVVALSVIAVFVLLVALIKFRKPIKKFTDHCENVVNEACDEWEAELREKALDRMREFLEKDKYVSPRIVYERMRCGDADSRYYRYAHDKEKLHRVFESEDLQMAKELKKRQEKIRDLITVIESTGEWPKTISEIYEMMRIELK